MLRELHISNLAIIENIDIELSAGLHVFTGQTGSGKSLILGALELLLGLRGGGEDAALFVRPGCREARVSGLFEISDPGASWMMIPPKQSRNAFQRTIVPSASLHIHHTQHFFNGCLARENAIGGGLAKRPHPLGNGLSLDGVVVHPIDDHFLDLSRHSEDLINTPPTHVPTLITVPASRAPPDLECLGSF